MQGLHSKHALPELLPLEAHTLRILITFALDLEFAPWRQLRPFAEIANSGLAFYEADFDGTRVRVAVTGVGGARARNVAGAALQWPADICIAAGLAGSLRREHEVGRVCVSQDIMEMESGRTVTADAGLVSEAEKCGAVVMERLLTSSAMVLSGEGKSRLGRMAGAVEMESFAVASEAAARGIPVLAIRAISDGADEDLPMNFGELLDEQGNVSKAKAARALARAPQKLRAVMRLGRQSKTAASNLARFLERYVTALTMRGDLGAREMAEAKRG